MHVGKVLVVKPFVHHIVTHIQVLAQIFHHLTYVSEARFTCHLDNLILWCAVLKELRTAHQYNKCLIILTRQPPGSLHAENGYSCCFFL